MQHKALNQLLCAATVNVQFRETLLHNPAQAIATGYLGHQFCLTPEERDMVLGIQAGGLEDFAAQVYHWISRNGTGKKGLKHGPDLLVPADPYGEPYRVGLSVPA